MKNTINGERIGFIFGGIIVLALLLSVWWRFDDDSMVINECDSIISTVPAELKAPADGTTAKTD